MNCNLCTKQARYNFGAGHALCDRCTSALLKRCKISKLPSQGVNATAIDSSAPKPTVAVADNSELMCVEPSLIRVLDAGRSGRTDCSLIDSIGRDPVDGAVKAWSPGLKAVTGDNSSSCGSAESESNGDVRARAAVNCTEAARRRHSNSVTGEAGVASGPHDSILSNPVHPIPAPETPAGVSFQGAPATFSFDDIGIPAFLRRAADNSVPARAS